MKPLNVLSLFDGICCGRVALERIGIPIGKYFASEINQAAIKVTQKNYPDTIQLGDVRNINFKDEMFKDIDIIIAGSPCQSNSIYKTSSKEGVEGLKNKEKSGLFFEFLRALEDIKPKYFLLENVAFNVKFRVISTTI